MAPAALAAPAALTHAQLALVTIARIAITVAFRIIYPLQPFLMGQLQVDLQTISALVTVQLLASLVSPVGGRLADTRGERTVMLAGLGLFCVGSLVCALSGQFTGLLAGYALVGLGMAFFQPSATAYLSARTPYARRAWALGVFETSWALAALLGVAPLMLLVQETRSASLVYWILLAFGLASMALVWLALPATRPPADAADGERRRGSWRALRTWSVAGALSMLALVMLSYDIYAVVQSPWLQQAFAADEARQGQVLAVIGAAELIGSLAVAMLVDRLGKRRSAVAGYLAAAACVALLPLSAGSWELLLALLFCFYLAEEFAIVAAIPLMSGVAPGARGTLLSLSVTFGSMARALGSALAASIFLLGGISASTLTSAALLLGAALLCATLVREAEAEG